MRGRPEEWPELVEVLPPGVQEAGEGWVRLVDDLWCRLVARGRIVRRARESEGGSYAVYVYLVEHPELDPGEVYALFEGPYTTRIYRCRPEGAIAVLQSGSAFNWA
jgi:hypothetical protein